MKLTDEITGEVMDFLAPVLRPPLVTYAILEISEAGLYEHKLILNWRGTNFVTTWTNEKEVEDYVGMADHLIAFANKIKGMQ